MKKISSFIALSGLVLWLAACKEPVIDEGILPLAVPATVDANGGNWRTVVLGSAADIAVPPPAATTSAAYQNELATVKNGVGRVTPEQNVALSYWAVGGVLRWNQIARQLMAKYNTGPGYDNVLGQIATGDTTNLFANSPNAARLYALLSVAQYDALVVTWRAKYQYNRPALAKQGVEPRVPVLDVPSYPSEDAAVAEASCRMLAFFFPDETAWLNARAAEHKQSRISAGANMPSDVKAGEDLAAAVAARVIARAQADRPGVETSWQTMQANAPYDVKWKSLEIPARSPVLPLAGNLKTWFDPAAVFAVAPGPPPVTTSSAFQTALAEVRDIANTRTREQWRIANYWADGIGTYTLPGHWNFIAEGLIQQDRQNELRAARTYALMNRAIQDGATVNWRTKYQYFVPRPSQIDPTIKTATGIPNYPSYASEYATFSTAAATVLAYVFPGEATRLDTQAAEAVLSQLYGGIHYRFDNDAGVTSGVGVGRLAVDWAKGDGAN